MKRMWKFCTILFLLTALLAACGGGGDNDGYSIDLNNSTDSGDQADTSDSQLGSFIDDAFQPGQLSLSVDGGEELAPGSTVTVTAAIVDDQNNLYETPVEVSFSSEFAQSGLASIEATQTTANGQAVSLYTARSGEGQDTITATAVIGGITHTATATLSLAGPSNVATHLEFVSASNLFIALKNTGGPPRPETALLTFKVTDSNGDPVAGQTIDFLLSTEIGGLYLSADSDVSDTDGMVSTTVNTGTVSTEVKVHATVHESDPLVTVVSDTLIVSTGLADQNSISISVDRFNPEGWHYNNVEVEVVFQAADHFNNFVPDGTVVYFTTELGSIDDSCELIDGVCTAIWRSGNPRDSYCDDLTPACIKGKATITAFLIGEESFTDFNGNGYFDSEDEFDIDTDMGEPFRDDNDNELRDDFEPWWDYNADTYYDGPNGMYNGSLCSDGADCTRELVYVQASTNIVMSGSFADTFTLAAGSGGLIVTIADVNGNPMPEGSKIEIIDASDDSVAGSYEVPSTLSATVFGIRVSAAGTYYGKITTPFGNVSYSDNTVTIE